MELYNLDVKKYNLPVIDCSSKTANDSFKNIQKDLYEHLYKCNSLTELKTKSYRRLLIDGFDDEQIFQQIQLQNESAFHHFSKNKQEVTDSEYIRLESKLHASGGEDKFAFEKNYVDSDDDDDNKEYIFDDDSDSSIEKHNSKKLKRSIHTIKSKSNGEDATLKSINEEDVMQDSDFSNDDELDHEDNSVSSLKALKTKKSKSKAQKAKFKSIVDDQFFKLSNLDEFLRIEDMKEGNKLEEDNKSEEDIDYYQDIPSDDFDEEDELESEAENKKFSKDIMYEDFFDAPESGDENVNGESEMLEDESNFNSDLEENGDEEDVSLEKDLDDEEEDQVINHQNFDNELEQTPKTPFEVEQEKIKKTIENYEDKLVQQPEWHLTGEIAASSRPKDSLLHQDTDFDVNAKPVLIEDSTLCEKTEKAIKSIVKNKAYSDGQRKLKTNDEVIAMKKEVILDQAKSKKSLATVYEDEYLKKKYGEEEQENPKHIEIKKMMDSLLPELQALFSHIPKPAIPDIKIVSNLPAINVEDVAPTSVSDVTLLAPEEIKKKTGVIKGVTERTDTDRKRERRKKKMMQKMKFKKAQTENPENLSTKDKKQEKINTLKKLKQNRSTKIAEVSGEKIKSSKDFFSHLQETVTHKAQPTQSNKKRRK